MHDWTLNEIRFDWRAARVVIELKDSTSAIRTLIAEGVTDLRVPRANEWGPSVNVNELFEIEELRMGLKRLRFEMQSGDEIQIIAMRFAVPVP